MTSFGVILEADEQELNDIFKELKEAEMTIMRCYHKLADMNVLKIKKVSIQESLVDDQSPKC